MMEFLAKIIVILVAAAIGILGFAILALWAIQNPGWAIAIVVCSVIGGQIRAQTKENKKSAALGAAWRDQHEKSKRAQRDREEQEGGA